MTVVLKLAFFKNTRNSVLCNTTIQLHTESFIIITAVLILQPDILFLMLH